LTLHRLARRTTQVARVELHPCHIYHCRHIWWNRIGKRSARSAVKSSRAMSDHPSAEPFALTSKKST
jgi:hypothetical protein